MLSEIQMRVELDEGCLCQHPFGNRTAPQASHLTIAPELQFDTFVTMGGLTIETSGRTIIPSGAIDIGGDSGVTFTDKELDITWAPSGLTPVVDPTDYLVARLTISDNAQGVLRLAARTVGEPSFTAKFPVSPIALAALQGPLANQAISVQQALEDGSGRLEIDARDLRGETCGISPTVTSVDIEDDDLSLFTAAINSSDAKLLDLGIDVDKPRGLPAGTAIQATLVVNTNLGSTLRYPLVATAVPEPASAIPLIVALAGLFAVRHKHRGCVVPR